MWKYIDEMIELVKSYKIDISTADRMVMQRYGIENYGYVRDYFESMRD